MPLVLADRVRETTTTTGTGTISLAGPVSGFQGFSTAIGNANTTYYTIVDAATGAWEVGLGTYTSSGSTLARTTVLSSSNSDALVPFASGTKDVFVTQPAERAVYVLGAGTGLAAGAAAFTANGVPYASATNTLTTGSALTFDGTTFKQNAGSLWITGGRSQSYSLVFSDWYIYNASTGGGLIWDNGSEQMRLTSTGLGIGQSSPAAKLDVLSLASSIGLKVRGGGNSGINILDIADAGGSGPMVLNASGNLGIGTSSPVYQTQIYGSGQTTAALTDAGNKGGSLLLNTPTVSAGDGGALLLGAGGSGAKPFAAIKGLLSDGGGNTTGAIAFSTRNATGDTALTERLRLDSSGNLGIGTTSPAYRLQITNTAASNFLSVVSVNTGTAGILLGDTDSATVGRVEYENLNNAMTFFTNGSERARIDSSGNVQIGTTGNYGSNVRLTLYRSSMPELVFADDNTPSAAAAPRISGGTAYMTFSTNGSERARIDSSGNLLVGTTTTGFTNSRSFTFQGVGDGKVYVNHSTANTNGDGYIGFGYNGTQIGSITQNGTTAVAYNTSSDYRLKHDIAPMTGALAKVAALKPVTYKWNVDNSAGEGFIAHELAEVCPAAVTGEKDAVDAEGKPVYQGIDTSFLVATLAAAIKELKAEFDAYKATHP